MFRRLPGLLALTAAFAVGVWTPAMAGGARTGLYAEVRNELSAQTARRPRITVYPRSTAPGPNARRYCRSWLEKEYRVSGPVIVPRMRCWWQ